MHKRRKIIIMLAAVFVFAAIMAFACHASSVTLMYDDVRYTANDSLILDRGTTFVSVRAVCSMRASFTALWNAENETAVFRSNGIEITAKIGEKHITANGKIIFSDSPVRLIGGRVYVPVRALAKALGADVDYDGRTGTVILRTTSDYIGNSQQYSTDDMYWMARIISAESCSEPYAGKIMVGNVVMNRKRNVQFPDTVYGVIFDRKNGTQFTPVSNGTIYKTPCSDCTAAAKAVLSGASRTENALYFVNTNIVPVSWVSNNRPMIVKVGSHTFYS